MKADLNVFKSGVKPLGHYFLKILKITGITSSEICTEILDIPKIPEIPVIVKSQNPV